MLDKGIALLKEILKKYPQTAVAPQYLRNDYAWRAYALDDLGRHAEAAKDWHSALELSGPSMAPKFRLGEAVSLARADGRHGPAIKLARFGAGRGDRRGRPVQHGLHLRDRLQR